MSGRILPKVDVATPGKLEYRTYVVGHMIQPILTMVLTLLRTQAWVIAQPWKMGSSTGPPPVARRFAGV